MPASRPMLGFRRAGCALSISLLLATALRAAGGAAAGTRGRSACADERIDRRADPEGVAQRRADPGEQLWSAGRSAGQRGGPRAAAVDRLRLRDRCRGLHHDQRARDQRRAPHPDRAACRSRRRHAGHGVVGQDEARDRADRRRHDRAGSRTAEGRGAEAAGAAAWRRTRRSVRARWSLHSAAPTDCATA